VWVGFNGVYKVYEGWVVTVDLVACSRAEFENFAVSRADKGGDNGGVFKGDEAVSCTHKLVQFNVVEGREVTSYTEEFCCGGVSDSLEMCKRGEETVVPNGLFESLVMQSEGWPDETEWSQDVSEAAVAGHFTLLSMTWKYKV
jgi:hypothetical protein